MERVAETRGFESDQRSIAKKKKHLQVKLYRLRGIPCDSPGHTTALTPRLRGGGYTIHFYFSFGGRSKRQRAQERRRGD